MRIDIYHFALPVARPGLGCLAAMTFEGIGRSAAQSVSHSDRYHHNKLRNAIAAIHQATTFPTAPANSLAAIVVEYCSLDTWSDDGHTTGHIRPLIEP